MFGIADHRKGEVGHVGGLAKVAIRQAVASGHLFINSNEMVGYLSNKFQEKANPTYVFKEILSKELDEERSELG